ILRAERVYTPKEIGSDRRLELRADCSACVGLCCVAPGFAESADFAFTKPAGQACPNLTAEFRCAVHADLRQIGMSGCTAYDCFGAGQRVTRTFGGESWRQRGELAAPMFKAFSVMEQLHELEWYLAEGLTRELAREIHEEMAGALADLATVAMSDA